MIQNGLMNEERRAKKIFIRMLSGLLGFTFTITLVYYFLNLPGVAFLNLLAAVCSPFAIWFSRRNHFLLSKVVMHFLVLFVVLGSCVIYGKESMILSFMVPLVQSALTIFNRREWPWTALFLSIILFFVPWLILTEFRWYPHFLSGGVLVTIQLINVVGAIGFSVIQITYATWVNEQFRETLEIRNEEALQTNQLLRSTLSTRDQLFNMLAHDLRSPFVALESGLIILDDLDVPEGKKWIVKDIRENAKNTLNLLDNTLDWARSQTNNIRFEPQELQVQEILNRISHSFSFQLKSKGISLHFETQSGIKAHADANMLYSIIQNLISNAIKFTRRDGNIWISVMALADGTEFRIRDSGNGMTTGEVNQLLDGGTFSKPGTSKEKGHGVGLLLVREFLQKHGSSLSIKSATGMGSEFSFILSARQIS